MYLHDVADFLHLPRKKSCGRKREGMRVWMRGMSLKQRSPHAAQTDRHTWRPFASIHTPLQPHSHWNPQPSTLNHRH